jgi:hypothetical protein
LADRDREALLADLEVGMLPEEKGVSVVQSVTVLAARLGVPLERQDVVFAERVGRGRGRLGPMAVVSTSTSGSPAQTVSSSTWLARNARGFTGATCGQSAAAFMSAGQRVRRSINSRPVRMSQAYSARLSSDL